MWSSVFTILLFETASWVKSRFLKLENLTCFSEATNVSYLIFKFPPSLSFNHLHFLSVLVISSLSAHLSLGPCLAAKGTADVSNGLKSVAARLA